MIVVGVDGSPASRAALDWALAEAGIRGAAVRAVLAWPGQLAAPQRSEGEAAALLDSLVVDAAADRADVEVERATVPGPPAQVLLDEADSAELLVVGSRGLGGVAGALLGSVSNQVAHHAACPVVIVRVYQQAA